MCEITLWHFGGYLIIMMSSCSDEERHFDSEIGVFTCRVSLGAGLVDVFAELMPCVSVAKIAMVSTLVDVPH